jgi:hypothetical protein
MTPTTDFLKIMKRMKKENEQARLYEYEEGKEVE